MRFRRGYYLGVGQHTDATVSCNGLRTSLAISTYFIDADPLAYDGSRFFATNQAGTLYESTERIRITHEGSPPAPATPMQ